MRPGLRARVTALLLLLSTVPPGVVVWLIRDRVLGLVRAEDEGRIEDALSEFSAAIAREGADTSQALTGVAGLLESDPRYRTPPGKTRATAPGPLPFPSLAQAAPRLMQDAGLDCLSILDASGVVIASGHAPDSLGRVERETILLPETSSSFLEETITPGVGRVLTLQSRRTVEVAGATVHVAGGRFIDAAFLGRLSPGGTVQALLLDRDGAIRAASDPRSPLPIPPGTTGGGAAARGRFLARGTPYAYRTIPLRDPEGTPAGTLVAAVSIERFARLSSSLTAIALAVVGASVAGSLLLGLALSRGVTGPLRRLEEMSRRIADGRFEPVLGLEAPGEVGSLVGAFNRMARSLAESRERLRHTERLAAAEEVARRVAHELKNPLSPIALTLEGLMRTKERRPEEFDRAFEEAARTIQEEVHRMRGILEDFSRFGRLPLPRPRLSDLNALVRQALSLYAGSASTARITADLDPALPQVPIDPDRIGEVLHNLLSNALQAVGEKGGAVLVSTRPAAGGVELRVRDDGPGMSEEVLKRLFEPYVSGRPGGTGLGLAIARRIVLDHGGTIEAGNRPEGGAEIRILLPLAGGEGRAAGEGGTAARGAESGSPGAAAVGAARAPEDAWRPS